MEDGRAPSLVPRLCHVVRWPDFNGYGFNLHAEKGKAGQFIGKVDEGSPAEAAGLREGDRIVEVNGINIGNENHQQVVSRIKSGGDETRLLVVDNATDMHYKGSMTVVRGDLPEVRFITAARDQQINANGSAHTTTTTTTTPASSSPPAAGVPAASPHYPVRLCRLRKWADFDGYGFNLHAEKDKPGQFIGAVDASSPAETGGLREGDRIVEVGGENIEALTHAGVIGRVKAGGDRVELLVLDPEADAYYKSLGVGVSSGMVGVTVISTPPTSSSSSSAAATESEMVTEAVAQEVESTPEPPRDEEPVPNGLQVEDKEEEEEQEAQKEEEEVVVSTIQVTQAAPVVEEVVNVEEQEKEKEEKNEEEEEQEEQEEAEGVGAMNDYEPVEVVAAVPTFSSPPAPAADEDLGVARYGGYGINGGSEVSEPEPTRPAEPEPAPTPVEPEPIPTAWVPEPEPEPAVIRSTVTTAAAPRGPLMGGGLELNVSAAEMKERLRARKKQDPRFHKTSFEAKSKMFEKL